VFPYWRRGDLGGPVEGEVDGGEAYCEVPGGVLGSEGGEGGEGLWESGRGWIGVRVGAGDSEGGQAPKSHVFFFFIFLFMSSLFLGTRSFVQR